MPIHALIGPSAGRPAIARPKLTIITVASLISIAVPAWAQAADEQPAVIKNIVGCARITANEERLRCFDRSVAGLNKDLADNRLAVLDSEGVKRTRRSLFGFPLPTIGLFGKSHADDDQRVTEIDGAISRMIPLANQRYELVLADGARWQTTEPTTDPFRTGDRVHIRQGALGSYWIAGPHRQRLRGRRVG